VTSLVSRRVTPPPYAQNPFLRRSHSLADLLHILQHPTLSAFPACLPDPPWNTSSEILLLVLSTAHPTNCGIQTNFVPHAARLTPDNRSTLPISPKTTRARSCTPFAVFYSFTSLTRRLGPVASGCSRITLLQPVLESHIPSPARLL
jgi:hypothetical protein